MIHFPTSPLGDQALAMLELAQRVFREPLGPGFLFGGFGLGSPVEGEQAGLVRLEHLVADRLRIAGAESRIFARIDIAQVAGDIHCLVVAHQHDHLAALLGCVLLELLQLAVDLERIRSAVRNVAQLDQHRIAARPAPPWHRPRRPPGRFPRTRRNRRGGRRSLRSAPARAARRPSAGQQRQTATGKQRASAFLSCVPFYARHRPDGS